MLSITNDSVNEADPKKAQPTSKHLAFFLVKYDVKVYCYTDLAPTTIFIFGFYQKCDI